MLEFFLAAAAGVAGGFARALLSGRLVRPSRDTDEDGKTLYDPGFIGTILVGAVVGVGVWLLSASPENAGVDFRPLGLALFAGAAGDVVIAYYVSEQYGASDQQETGEAIEQMASATNNQSREVEQAHEERRRLQKEVDELQQKVNELQAENDLLKKSRASGD